MKNKSGAARRLVSLMLALGLIFTLAPASVFAGNEGHDAYFYLKRYDAQAGGDLAKTDYYYIGKGKVDLDEPSQGEEYTANVQQRILRAPQDPIILDATNRDLTTYTYSDNGAEGTYSIRSWDVIKGESGATTAYPDNEPLVEGKATWHVDGTVELHMPAAYFYGLKPGANEGSEDPDDYYYIGSGKVALKSAETGKSVALTDENRGRVVAQAPTSFPAIEYNGVTYNYDTGGAAGT